MRKYNNVTDRKKALNNAAQKRQADRLQNHLTEQEPPPVQPVVELTEEEKIARDYALIISKFMSEGFSNDNTQGNENEQVQVEVPSALIDTVPKAEDTNNLEDEEPQFIPTTKNQVNRIQMKFIILSPQTSSLPRTMPNTLVYWNRCLTKVEQDNMQIQQWQLDNFHSQKGIKVHDYPHERDLNPDFPIISGSEIWADPRQEQFVNQIEKFVLQSPVVQDSIQQSCKPRPIEGLISRLNVRGSDVFFNSRFESGNLKQAFIVPKPSDYEDVLEEDMQFPEDDDNQKPNSQQSHIFSDNKNPDTAEPQVQKKVPKSEYNLYLQDDSFSDGSRTQWFYFSVFNIRAGTSVRFNIVNLTKEASSFTKGMQPFVYSHKSFLNKGIKWHRAGKKISYTQSRRQNHAQAKIMDIKFIEGPNSSEVQPSEFNQLYTLSFSYKFLYDFDTVYFAHYQPYTYQDLQNYLCKLALNNEIKDRLRIEYLCNSLGGNPVNYVTITDRIQTLYVNQVKEIFKWQKFEYQDAQNVDKVKPKKIKKYEDDSATKNQSVDSIGKINLELQQKNGRLSRIPELIDDDVESDSDIGNKDQNDIEDNKIKVQKKPQDKFYKKCIFITARVHPGDPQTSFIAEGLINFLISNDEEAKEIRSKFVIKIVPMLNPDGVIIGNTRACLLGTDLNRRWVKPSKFLHPQIYYTKSLIKYLNKKMQEPEVKAGGVVTYLDLHGHHHSMDMFMYGCTLERDMAYYEGYQIVKAIPDGVDRLLPVFNTRKCRFANEPEKMNTGRIVLYKEFKIYNSYTFQCSFFGSEYLRKVKPIYAQLYNKEFNEQMIDSYMITSQRQDVYYDREIIELAASDLMRGINYASKKKPILQLWFRTEPIVIIDIHMYSKRTADGEIDEQLELLKEMESKWRPTAALLDERRAGMGGDAFQYMNEGPTVDEKLILQRVKERKQEKALKRLQKKQQQEAQRLKTNKPSLQEINPDLANVTGKNFSLKKDNERPKSKKPVKKKLTAKLPVKVSGVNVNLSDSESVQTVLQEEPQVKIQIRDGTGVTKTITNSYDSTIRQPRLVNELLNTQQRQEGQFSIQISTSGELLSPKDISPQVQDPVTVANTFYIDLPHRQLIQQIVDRGDLLEIMDMTDTKGLNKKNKANFVNYRVSQVEALKGEQLEPQVRSKDIKSKNVKVQADQIKQPQKPAFLKNQSMLIQQNNSNSDLKLVNNQDNGQQSDTIMQKNRSVYIDSQLSDVVLLKPQYNMQPDKRSMNKLAVDPIVFNSENFQSLSRINLQTIEKHQQKQISPLQSPSKSLFVPSNGVYSQNALLMHQGLAQRNDIHFVLDEQSHFAKRKMTQIETSLPPLQQSIFGQPKHSDQMLTPHSKRVIQMRNGFEMLKQENQSLSPGISQKERLQQTHRPHIILKPLSDVDWQAISNTRKKQLAGSQDIESEQRNNLKKLQQVIGSLEISDNKIKIGRHQLTKLQVTPVKHQEYVWPPK